MNTAMLKYCLLISVIGLCCLMTRTLYSCGDKNNYDEVEYLTVVAIDSLETEFRLDDIINGGYIAVNGRNKYESGNCGNATI